MIKTNVPQNLYSLLAMQRYEEGLLYAALPLHIQRDCFWIRAHDQNRSQLYHYALPSKSTIKINSIKFEKMQICMDLECYRSFYLECWVKY